MTRSFISTTTVVCLLLSCSWLGCAPVETDYAGTIKMLQSGGFLSKGISFGRRGELWMAGFQYGGHHHLFYKDWKYDSGAHLYKLYPSLTDAEVHSYNMANYNKVVLKDNEAIEAELRRIIKAFNAKRIVAFDCTGTFIKGTRNLYYFSATHILYETENMALDKSKIECYKGYKIPFVHKNWYAMKEE